MPDRSGGGSPWGAAPTSAVGIPASPTTFCLSLGAARLRAHHRGPVSYLLSPSQYFPPLRQLILVHNHHTCSPRHPPCCPSPFSPPPTPREGETTRLFCHTHLLGASCCEAMGEITSLHLSLKFPPRQNQAFVGMKSDQVCDDDANNNTIYLVPGRCEALGWVL